MKLYLYIPERIFSEAAVLFAGLLAQLTGGVIAMHTVVKRRGGGEAAERALARARALLPPEVRVEEHIHAREKVDGMIAVLEQDGTDLVIVGVKPGARLLRRMMGSISQKVINHATKPVAVVRHPVKRLERLLVCTGGLELSERVIEAGTRLAKAVGAQVTLLYVSGVVPSMYTGLAEMEETLEELLEADTPLARHLRRGAEILCQQEVEGELELRRGVVVENILREAHKGDYDLIVIGSSAARSSLKGWLLGDVTGKVVARASHPVLIVK